eukprot:4587177-Amphidinium_carterae.1
MGAANRAQSSTNTLPIGAKTQGQGVHDSDGPQSCKFDERGFTAELRRRQGEEDKRRADLFAVMAIELKTSFPALLGKVAYLPGHHKREETPQQPFQFLPVVAYMSIS